MATSLQGGRFQRVVVAGTSRTALYVVDSSTQNPNKQVVFQVNVDNGFTYVKGLALMAPGAKDQYDKLVTFDVSNVKQNVKIIVPNVPKIILDDCKESVVTLGKKETGCYDTECFETAVKMAQRREFRGSGEVTIQVYPGVYEIGPMHIRDTPLRVSGQAGNADDVVLKLRLPEHGHCPDEFLQVSGADLELENITIDASDHIDHHHYGDEDHGFGTVLDIKGASDHHSPRHTVTLRDVKILSSDNFKCGHRHHPKAQLRIKNVHTVTTDHLELDPGYGDNHKRYADTGFALYGPVNAHLHESQFGECHKKKKRHHHRRQEALDVECSAEARAARASCAPCAAPCGGRVRSRSRSRHHSRRRSRSCKGSRSRSRSRRGSRSCSRRRSRSRSCGRSRSRSRGRSCGRSRSRSSSCGRSRSRSREHHGHHEKYSHHSHHGKKHHAKYLGRAVFLEAKCGKHGPKESEITVEGCKVSGSKVHGLYLVQGSRGDVRIVDTSFEGCGCDPCMKMEETGIKVKFSLDCCYKKSKKEDGVVESATAHGGYKPSDCDCDEKHEKHHHYKSDCCPPKDCCRPCDPCKKNCPPKRCSKCDPMNLMIDNCDFSKFTKNIDIPTNARTAQVSVTNCRFDNQFFSATKEKSAQPKYGTVTLQNENLVSENELTLSAQSLGLGDTYKRSTVFVGSQSVVPKWVYLEIPDEGILEAFSSGGSSKNCAPKLDPDCCTPSTSKFSKNIVDTITNSPYNDPDVFSKVLKGTNDVLWVGFDQPMIGLFYNVVQPNNNLVGSLTLTARDCPTEFNSGGVFGYDLEEAVFIDVSNKPGAIETRVYATPDPLKSGCSKPAAGCVNGQYARSWIALRRVSPTGVPTQSDSGIGINALRGVGCSYSFRGGRELYKIECCDVKFGCSCKICTLVANLSAVDLDNGAPDLDVGTLLDLLPQYTNPLVLAGILTTPLEQALQGTQMLGYVDIKKPIHVNALVQADLAGVASVLLADLGLTVQLQLSVGLTVTTGLIDLELVDGSATSLTVGTTSKLSFVLPAGALLTAGLSATVINALLGASDVIATVRLVRDNGIASAIDATLTVFGFDICYDKPKVPYLLPYVPVEPEEEPE